MYRLRKGFPYPEGCCFLFTRTLKEKKLHITFVCIDINFQHAFEMYYAGSGSLMFAIFH